MHQGCEISAAYLSPNAPENAAGNVSARKAVGGEDQFVPVSWDEALTTIASRLTAIMAASGAEAILPYSYAGNMGMLQYGSMDRRFFHAIGASQRSYDLRQRRCCGSHRYAC